MKKENVFNLTKGVLFMLVWTFSVCVFAQNFTVRGKVIDDQGDPLPGVNIVVKGEPTIGTVTDAEGNYTITVPYPNATLIFSYVGFQPQEIRVNNRSIINVTLVEDTKALEEVVVVGYSTQKKETIVGSVATITTKDLKQSPTANINNALAGRMPGLMVNQFIGGEPGVDRAEIYIRGFATTGDKSPIIIVDGVERDMSYLSAEEIETFTILKDASATAQYGVRGANGVIVVTTKRGKAEEKATVNFKASFGTNNPVKFPEYLGSADYAILYNEALINDNPGVDPSTLNLFSQQAIENFKNAKGDNSDGRGYNWDYFDYAFKPGTQQDYALSVRGGSSRARYYVMANYFKQTGNYKHTNLAQYDTQAIFQRYNFRANVDVDINKDFYLRLDLGARVTDRNAPGTTATRVVNFANTQPPYLPILLEQNDNPENTSYYAKNPLGLLFGDQFYRFNILGELSRNGYLNEKNSYLNGTFALGYKLDFITPGLKTELVFSYDAGEGRWIHRTLGTYSEGYREYPKYATFTPKNGGANVYMEPGHYTGPYINGNKYTVDETIGKGFSHNAATSKTYYQFRFDYQRAFGPHDVSGLLLFNRSSYTVDAEIPFRYQGIAARATYGYANRYLAEFNLGYNGSENFAKENRYGFFPAGAIGWVISEEPFMQNTKNWLQHLKLRVSYGRVGSDKTPSGIPRFSYLQFFETGGNYYFGTQDFSTGTDEAVREGPLANKSLTWEKSEKLNVGVDAAILNQRLTFSIDFFKEHRYDIFTNLSGGDKLGFPDIVGKDAPWINSTIVDNHGLDFEVGYSGRIGRDFRFMIRPNFTFARNKIVFMNEIPYENEWRKATGKRLSEHFVYVFDHFVADQTEADKLNNANNGAGYQPWGTLIPGDVVYKDLNDDGKIDDLGDRMAMGYPRTPEIHFGIPVTLQYKGFDFSFLFQGAANSSVLLHGPAVYDFPVFDQDKYGKVKKMHLNRWTPETAETATYPALHFSNNPNNKNPNSSLFLYDAKYIRLKNIELGYNLPRKAMRFAGFQNVRIYVQGMNLLTFDGLGKVDIDPETRDGDGSWYPVQRIFNFGVDITY